MSDFTPQEREFFFKLGAKKRTQPLVHPSNVLPGTVRADGSIVVHRWCVLYDLSADSRTVGICSFEGCSAYEPRNKKQGCCRHYRRYHAIPPAAKS